MALADLDFSDLPTERQTRKPSIADLTFEDIHPAPLSALQGAGAVATGFNRGVLAGVAGLPAKTGADLIDLARAAYGYAGNKLGLIKPDELPAPLDRSRVIGSPEWIAARIEDTGPVGRAIIDNPRPDLPAARVLNAGGYGIGTGLSGRPVDATINAASGMSGQLATEAGADPAWSMLASLMPQTAQQAIAGGVRVAMRGGESGRQEMQQRIADFQAAGVDPTVGLATGRRVPQAIEATLARAPGAAGTMAAKVDAMRGQLQDTVNAQRDAVSPDYGPAVAGQAIKRGAETFREQQQADYGRMLDRALARVPEEMRFPVANMIARGELTIADIEGAPNVSGVLNQPKSFTQNVLSALDKDAAPKGPQAVASPILNESGQPFMSEIPGTPGGLGIEGIRGLKSRVGELAFKTNPLNADANTGALKALYGGAKADLLNAASLADAELVKRGQQPGVRLGLEDANRYYQVTSDVLDNVLAPLHRTAEISPEKAYARVEGMAKTSGGNVQRLMASVPLDARRQIAATVIDELGKANPGQQNADGSGFSPQTFLTNYNKLDAAAKTGIFGLGVKDGGKVQAKLDLVAKAAERMRDAGKVYANPSGTAGALAAYGAAGGIGTGLSLIGAGQTHAGMATLSSILGSAAASKLTASAMTNPKFVDWLAQATVLPERQIPQHLRRLALMASQEKDPQQRAAIQSFYADLSAESGLR